MLYSKDRDDSFFITKNFENCYMGDANRPQLGKRIFLLYRYQMTVDYIKFERKIMLTPDFNTDYDYGMDRKVMYVIDIHSEHEADFVHFQNGEYSKFSEEYKKKILAFWRVKNEDSNFYGVLFPNDAAKNYIKLKDPDTYVDGECWPKPVQTREIYMYPN
jgi:hypothetical protein